MTTPRPRARWRSWSGRLWILAAVLGAGTILHAASIIHDTGERREAVQMATRAAADQAAARAAERLELLATATFAPAAWWGAPAPPAPRAAVEALARGQREGVRCGCRELLPAREFFRVALATGAVERAAVERAAADAGAGAPTIADAQLVALARGEAARPVTPRRPGVRLTMGPAPGGQAVVTVVQRDGGAAPVAVYGLVADAGELRRALLRPAPADEREDVLGGLAVTAEPSREHQLAHHAIVPFPLDRLWVLAHLLLATVVVVIVAAGAARREALLARARSDFIAGVSHDLRMPLAQILLAGETLAMRRERDEAARLALVGSIVREARRLVALVENILLYSRAGSVELRPRLEPVPVDALLADVVEAVQLAVEDAGQRIEVADAAGVLTVRGDRDLLRQALVNLVDNALKYGAPGQRIRLDAAPAAPGVVRLLVDDEGPGIPAAERGRVFEPYERLTRDQTSERTGTGLGLAVVRQIARACGGRVWLEDAPGGRGARAVLELRTAEPPGPAPASEPRAAGVGMADQ